jgi:outer membrane protein TolC
MRKIFIHITFLIALGAMAVMGQAATDSGYVVTLNQALKLCVQNRPLLKQKEEDLNSLHYRIEQQKSSYLPELDAELSYTRIAPLPEFAFGGSILELAPANNYNAVVAARYILYDFGKRDAQLDALRSHQQSLLDEQNLIKSTLTNQTVRVLYTVLFLKQSIIEKQAEAATLKEHLKITEGKIASGTATEYDVLSTNTRLADNENAIVELKNEQVKQEIALKELIGLNRKEQVSVKGDFFTVPTVTNADSLMEVALAQRPEFKLIADAQNSARLQKASISLMNKPVLNGEAMYGLKNGYEPNLDVIRGNWAVGVTLGIPIFNGNLRENREMEVESGVLASDQKIQQTKDAVSTEIYQALNDLASNNEKLSITQKQIAYAEKSLERAQLQYESGTGTNLDVLDASTMLTQARLVHLQIVFREVLNFYTLKNAVGDKLFE